MAVHITPGETLGVACSLSSEGLVSQILAQTPSQVSSMGAFKAFGVLAT